MRGCSTTRVVEYRQREAPVCGHIFVIRERRVCLLCLAGVEEWRIAIPFFIGTLSKCLR